MFTGYVEKADEYSKQVDLGISECLRYVDAQDPKNAYYWLEHSLRKAKLLVCTLELANSLR